MTGDSVDVAGLVLDLDDTLYLERDYVRSGFEAVGNFLWEAQEVHGFAEHAWGSFVLGHRGDIFDRALRGLGVSADAPLIARLVSVYRAHTPDIRLLPDAARLLDQAKERGSAIALITDGPSESQWQKVDALGLRSWCAPIVVTASARGVRAKPDPSSFLHVQRSLGMQPAELIYVGDNPAKDFKAPSVLGWRTLRVRREGALHHAVASGADVDHEVVDLWEVGPRLWSGDT